MHVFVSALLLIVVSRNGYCIESYVYLRLSSSFTL